MDPLCSEKIEPGLMEVCPVCGEEHPIESIVEHVNQCLNAIEAVPKEEKDPPKPTWQEYKDWDFDGDRRMQEEENER